MAALTVVLLKNYGVDGYGGMLIYKKIAGWIFSGLIMGMFFYINIPIRKCFAHQQKQLQDNKKEESEQSIALPE